MNRIILFSCLCFAGIISYSQNYFNERITLGQPGLWSGTISVFLLPDGYVSGGTTGTPGKWYWHRLGFYKTDFQGNKIFSKVYGDTLAEYYIGEPGSIVRINDTLIVAAGSNFRLTSNWVHDEGLLYFLNNDFDTLFVKHFGDKSLPVDTAYILYQLKKLSTSSIITVGLKKPYGLADKIILIKTDRYGNEIWEKNYGNIEYYEGHSVICTNDGGFAIGGIKYHITPPPNITYDPILIKTDSSGNQQWILNLGGDCRDGQAMVCNSVDGNIVVGTTLCDSMPGFDPYGKINIIKIDNFGNIVWNKKYGKSEYDLTLTNIREDTDGSLIATGITPQFFDTAYKYVGWILKTDNNGDSLWYRQYYICAGESSYNYLYDVVQAPDNGYFACGVVYPQPPDTGTQDGWILKVDSLGCVSPGDCWVGIKPEKKIPESVLMKIFPDPAGDYINIYLYGTNQRGKVNLRLFDIYGRLVKEMSLNIDQTRIHLDIPDLPDGLYIIMAKSGDKLYGKEAFVKHKE